MINRAKPCGKNLTGSSVIFQQNYDTKYIVNAVKEDIVLHCLPISHGVTFKRQLGGTKEQTSKGELWDVSKTPG